MRWHDRRRTTWTRTLALAFIALGLAGCACLLRNLSAPGRNCESLNDQHVATISATRDQPADFLRVPVVIHLMTDPTDPTGPPEGFWTPTRIDTYFGAGNTSVNAVWTPAQIHFSLTRVERCLYTPPPGTYKVKASLTKAMLPPDTFTLLDKSPAEQQVIIDHYLQLNVDYGCCRTLNVYLWRTIEGLTNGYGESPRRNRPEVQQRHLKALPTVWYESGLACVGSGGDVCQLGLAHEFGHALGLRHSCDACSCCSASSPQGTVCPCEVNAGTLNACGEAFGCCGASTATLGRLMFPAAGAFPASGFALCAGEIDSARLGAQEFF